MGGVDDFLQQIPAGFRGKRGNPMPDAYLIEVLLGYPHFLRQFRPIPFF